MDSKSMELKCNVFWFCIAGIKAPICAVSGAQYLAASGWTELRNAIDLDVPFRLFRDEGRTFLQVKIKQNSFITESMRLIFTIEWQIVRLIIFKYLQMQTST